MPDKGKTLSIYLNAELLEKLDRLCEHMGYGRSETIANLIDVRDNEIKDGVTRRQTMSQVQKDLLMILEAQTRALEGIAFIRRKLGG